MKIAVIGVGKVGSLIAEYLKDKVEIILFDIRNDNSSFTSNYEDLKDVDVAFVAVPTPYKEEIKSLDDSIVNEVIKNLLNINKKVIIYIKSTLPVGGTSKIIKNNNYQNIFYTPEFFKQNDDIFCFKDMPRLIFGSSYEAKEAEELYFSLFKDVKYKCSMSLEEAEAVKLFSNAYLAYRINYFNEISEFASLNNLDDLKIIEAISLDPRIGNLYNKPSYGYAGKCLPKDVKALGELCKDIEGDVIFNINQSNEKRIKKYFLKIKEMADKFDNPIIGFSGLVKENDATPLVDIILLLLKEGCYQLFMPKENGEDINEVIKGIEFISKEKLYQVSHIIVDVSNNHIYFNKR